MGAVRIASTYRVTSQGYDEPGHIAAGMEWLDRGTYVIDPFHPPLSRVAMALPLYLAGERLPTNLPDPDPVHPDTAANNNLSYTAVGNGILYDSGHYLRNLSLARSGIVPFFLLGAAVVFLWTRKLFGDVAGVIAVALFTTLPAVLAFSGLAYTDLPAASMQFACIFVFVCWVEEPGWRSTAALGCVAGLAFLTKFTTLLFVPCAAVAIIACKWWMTSKTELQPAKRKNLIPEVAVALLIASLVSWGGYRFSRHTVRETLHISPQTMPSFQHFPAVVRPVARYLVLRNPSLPAIEVMNGLAGAWTLNSPDSSSYLFGRSKTGAWWYFFIAALALKTPIPFLILCILGGWFSFKVARERGRWQVAAPLAAIIALLVASTRVHYDVGLRHFLVLYPLLAVVAAAGAVRLWSLRPDKKVLGYAVLAALLVAQSVSSFRAGNDYISYFNAFAARDPSHDLVTGCDFDCGQDLFRLSAELKEKGATHVVVAAWTSAELNRIGLPPVGILAPFQPASGWVAISARARRLGNGPRIDYPPGAFSWLARYRPVAQVGRTIRLYYIPGDDNAVRAANASVSSLPPGQRH